MFLYVRGNYSVINLSYSVILFSSESIQYFDPVKPEAASYHTDCALRSFVYSIELYMSQ